MTGNVHSRLGKMRRQVPPFRCHRCGGCCGPHVPCLRIEATEIAGYARTHGISAQTDRPMDCPWLRNGNECLVYAVRPMLCRLQGLIPGLPCPHSAPVRNRQAWFTVVAYEALTRLHPMATVGDPSLTLTAARAAALATDALRQSQGEPGLDMHVR